MDMDILNILQGILSTIYISITLIIILILLNKYRKFREFNIILVSIAIFGLISPYLPDSIIFITILLSNGIWSQETYLSLLKILVLIVSLISTISLIGWIFLITNLRVFKYKIPILIFGLIYIGVFAILFIAGALIDFTFIGYFYGPFDYQWGLITTVYYLILISIILITGISFARKSIRVEDKEIRLKGKMILLAILSFVIGALIPFLLYSIVILVITRIILISCAIEFYLGFTLPEWFKRLMIKE